jgi:hypothetical protein
VSLNAAALIILIEMQVKRSNHLKIWNSFSSIKQNCKLTEYIFNKMESRLYKRFAIKFYLIFLIFVLVECHVGRSILLMDVKWFQYWVLSTLPAMICRLLYLLHTFYMELLLSYLKVMKQELDELVRFSRYSLTKNVERSVIGARLLVLKQMYGLLVEATMEINETFAWSQAFNFIHIFVQDTGDFLWMYKSFTYYFKGSDSKLIL